MVCQVQCRLQDERLSLVVPHCVQHHGILGRTRALAGPEKPAGLRGHWVHMAGLVLQGGHESVGQHLSIMSSPGQAVDRLRIASCGSPFPVGPGF